MKFRALILILITVAFFIPTASANIAAEDYGIGEITVTGEGQNVPNYGYWVYGEVKNYEIYNIKEVRVAVMLYDQSGSLLDNQTTLVSPNVINTGTRAPFLVKSNIQQQVFDVRFRILSYERTPLQNFPYIVLSDVSEVSQGAVTGTITNTHPYINLNEVEIIATFYDYEGNIDDIKHYGANGYSQFNAGASEDFTITSDILTPYTVNLVTQCTMGYREPEIKMEISDKRPVEGNTILLNITVEPKFPLAPAQIVYYPPHGDSYPVPIELHLDGNYYTNIEANEVGTWKVEFNLPATLMDQSRIYVENKVVEETYTVIEAPKIDTGGTTDSEIDDNITDDITEKITDSIPSYPIASIILGLAALSAIYRRRLAYDI